jgi:hypothetical protein
MILGSSINSDRIEMAVGTFCGTALSCTPLRSSRRLRVALYPHRRCKPLRPPRQYRQLVQFCKASVRSSSTFRSVVIPFSTWLTWSISNVAVHGLYKQYEKTRTVDRYARDRCDGPTSGHVGSIRVRRAGLAVNRKDNIGKAASGSL